MPNSFEYQRPTDEQVAQISEVREGCKALHELLQRVIPNSRRLSVAITKLEEVSMWANKAIVFPGDSDR